MTLSTEHLHATPEGIARAATIIKRGGLVAFGTETVYGLGADATSEQAVNAVYRAKGRPRINPLIGHFYDAAGAFAHVLPNTTALLLAEAFWPGPLTLILPRRPGSPICAAATAQLPSLAVRVPKGEITRAFLKAAGRPVVAPSANPSGRVSPSCAQHVLSDMAGRVNAVLDSGPCPVGLESTIIDLCGEAPRLMRPGGVAREDIENVCGPLENIVPVNNQAPSAPGQFSSHYAPALRVRMEATQVERHEALLAFGAPLPGSELVLNLSPSADLQEAAAKLFEGLRFLDTEGRRRGYKGIAVMPIPKRGIGYAIYDRLLRASAPRDI